MNLTDIVILTGVLILMVLAVRSIQQRKTCCSCGTCNGSCPGQNGFKSFKRKKNNPSDSEGNCCCR